MKDNEEKNKGPNRLIQGIGRGDGKGGGEEKGEIGATNGDGDEGCKRTRESCRQGRLREMRKDSREGERERGLTGG